MMKIIIILLLLVVFPSQAEIYKWVDENGKVHFSDRKPESEKTEELKLEVNTYTHVTFESSTVDIGLNRKTGSKKVVMYSTEWCGYCEKARRYFKKSKIRFTEYDIEKNAKAKRRYDKMGAKGIPVILVGKKRMNGFSEKGFKRIYE